MTAHTFTYRYTHTEVHALHSKAAVAYKTGIVPVRQWGPTSRPRRESVLTWRRPPKMKDEKSYGRRNMENRCGRKAPWRENKGSKEQVVNMRFKNCKPRQKLPWILLLVFFVVFVVVGWLVGLLGVFWGKKKSCKFFIKECPKAQFVSSEVYPREGCFLPCVITAGHGGTTSPAYSFVLIRVSCVEWCVPVWGQEEKGFLLVVPNMR